MLSFPGLEWIQNLDHTLQHFLNRGLSTPWLDFFMLRCTQSAEILAQVTVALAVMLGWRRLPRGRALQLLCTALSVAAFSPLLKHLFLRPRPLAALPDVRVLGPQLTALSFPSGHTMFAFAVAWWAFKIHRGWGALLLAWAAGVGVSRIYVGAHFPSDVLAGAVIGILIAWGCEGGVRLVLRDASLLSTNGKHRSP